MPGPRAATATGRSTSDDFEATGGWRRRCRNHADEIYDALPDDRHRDRLREGLQGADRKGIGQPRHPPAARGWRNCGRSPDVAIDDTVKTVLDAFRGPGVTFLMPGAEVELTDRTVIDLSHESLMRGWTAAARLGGGGGAGRGGSSAACRTPPGSGATDRPACSAIPICRSPLSLARATAAQCRVGRANTAATSRRRSAFWRPAKRSRTPSGKPGRRPGSTSWIRLAQLAEAQQLRLEHQQRSARKLRKMIGGLAVVAVIAGVACVVAMIANRRANGSRTTRGRARSGRSNPGWRRRTPSAVVESQKTAVEGSLSKAEAAEAARAAARRPAASCGYTTDMRLAPFVWSDDRTTAEQLRALLAKHVPEATAGRGPGRTSRRKPDLRGFEWHYYQHLLEGSATVFSGHGAALVGCSFTPDGQLVTLDQKGQLKRWDPGSEVEDEGGRRDLPGGPGAQVRVLSPSGRMVALAEGSKVRVLDTSTGKEAFSIDSVNNPRAIAA